MPAEDDTKSLPPWYTGGVAELRPEFREKNLPVARWMTEDELRAEQERWGHRPERDDELLKKTEARLVELEATRQPVPLASSIRFNSNFRWKLYTIIASNRKHLSDQAIADQLDYEGVELPRGLMSKDPSRDTFQEVYRDPKRRNLFARQVSAVRAKMRKYGIRVP
jgi:hypothetical protein